MTNDQGAITQSIPVFAGHVESKAAEVLNVLIFAHGGGDAPIHAEQLIPIRASLTSLVDCLFPIKGDHADFAGADSLDGIDYIHPTRVAALAAVIGRALGMPRSELINLAMAAALMNIGYLALRRSLLDQPRRLLDGEWEEHIHTHPDRGVKLLARSGLPDDCLLAIAHHHERCDGSGYPAGLRRDAISRHSRIIAVADTYVSLRSIRPHRPPVDAEVALAEIAGGRGEIFDPGVVDAFEDVIARFAGIMRPDRAGPAARTSAAATSEAHAAAQRDRADAIDSAAPAVDQTYAGEDEDDPSSPREHGRVRAAPTRRGETAAGRPRAVAARAAKNIDVHVVAASPDARRVARPAPVAAVAPRRRRRPRRAGSRRTHRHGGLFGPKLYIDAALGGRWPVDRLPR